MELNWEAIGAVGEILGAIAVFGSLAYLSIQIRASNASSRASAIRETLDRWDIATDQVWENPDIAKFMRTTMRGENASITQDEVMVFAIRLSHLVQIHYSVLQMAESGLVPDQLMERVDNALATFLSSPGGKAWWDSTGYMMPQSEYIDRLLRENRFDQSFIDWDDALYSSVEKAQESDA